MSAGDVAAVRAYRCRLLGVGLALMVLSGLCQTGLEPERQARRGHAEQTRALGLIEGAHAVERVALRPPRGPMKWGAPVDRVAWRVLDRQGRCLGYAVPFEGLGFQQSLSGTVAVDACCERVLAVAVHDAHESPGEDLFERHPWFLEQLAGRGCQAPIRLVPTAAGGVHAISGASVSSHVLVRHVNEALSALKATLAETR